MEERVGVLRVINLDITIYYCFKQTKVLLLVASKKF